LLSAAALLGLTAGQALAADTAPPPSFDWTGAYIGVNGGYGFSGTDKVGVTGFGNVGDLSVHGGFGGIQLGYNEQMDSIVLGIEGDWQFGSIRDSGGIPGWNNSDKISDFGTLRGRVGFAADQALIYATGGLAFGSIDYKATNGTVLIKDKYSDVGYTFGGGIEYAFDYSWSMKAEYMYVNLGSKRLRDSVTSTSTKATPNFQTVRVGFNYRF
ncbi:MAG: porin family protein, partial [Rhizobiales bacterium]|nr:porin family protein [Hyphomicrobiales bacterium]